VTIDGRELQEVFVGVKRPINPGTYQVVARSDSGSTVRKVVEVAEGANEVVTLDLAEATATPSPAPADDSGVLTSSSEPPAREEARPNRVPAYVSAGVGVVGLTVGTVFLFSRLGSDKSADEEFQACEPDCTDADKEGIADLDGKAASAGTASLIGYGVGGAALVTAVVLFATGTPKKSSRERGVKPYLAPLEIGLTGRF
jgi:hypothetical protein